jgi:DNA-binding MarR family transcriptional regulator
MTHPPSRSLPIDDSLFFRLVRLINLTARPFHASFARRYDISLNEWRTMVVLASHPGVSASEVAAYTGLDKMSVSRTVAALERHGRVIKDPDRSDKRRTLLALSDAGHELFEAIARSAKQREQQLFKPISAEERATLAAIAGKLIDGLLRVDGEDSVEEEDLPLEAE